MQRFIHLSVVAFIALTISDGAVAQTASNYDALVQQGQAEMNAGNNDVAFSTANSAIKAVPDRWEAYAVAGGALMNLKRYEDAADQFSYAIDRAPEKKQDQLRELRKKCVVAESGASSAPISSPASALSPSETTTQAEIVLWKTIENSTKSSDFHTYLAQYPNGAFATLARERLAKAEQEERQQFARYGNLPNSVWTGSALQGGQTMMVVIIFLDGGKLAWEGGDPGGAKLEDMKSHVSTLSKDALISAYSTKLNNQGTFEVQDGAMVRAAFSSANASAMHCSLPFEGRITQNTLTGNSHFVGDNSKEGRKCEKWPAMSWNLQRQYQ